MNSLLNRLTQTPPVRAALHWIQERINPITQEDDSGWRGLNMRERDAEAHTYLDNADDSLEAYRVNPMAYRIIELTTSYVLGQGLTIEAHPSDVDAFVKRFWHHKLNNMDARLHQWLNELSLTGDLFVTFATNQYDGMTYVRAVPSEQIDDIETEPHDYEQETRFHQTTTTDRSTRWWTQDEMRHYSINRVVGATRGQGDLVPILPWLQRYKDWLTDRVIINKFKGAYLWDVTITGAPQATITAKQNKIAGNPPAPASVIVHNEAEVWKAVQPDIKADDVEADGKAFRLMIAAGAGTPLHFLGEGEGANRATAQEMGDPTRRHYEKRQQLVAAIVRDVLTEVITRARAQGALRPSRRQPTIAISFPDLSTTDNLAVAQAMAAAVTSLETAVAHNWIDDATASEWLRHIAQKPQVETPTIEAGADTPDDKPPAQAGGNATP